MEDTFDKLPPHDIEAEKCLLASMMLDPEIIERVAGQFNRDAFYTTDNQIIFDILMQMNMAGLRIDAITLRAQLAKRMLLEEIGGTAYIAEILGTVPSAAHWESYQRIIKNKAHLRGAIAAANEVLRSCYSPLHDGDEMRIVESAIESLEKLKATGTTVPYRRISELMIDFFEERTTGDGSLFIPTCLRELDEIIYGFPVPGFSVAAARASMGKSLFAKQCAREVAAHSVPTLIVSIEENERKIAGNQFSSIAGIDGHNVFYGKWSEQTTAQAAESLNHVAMPFFVATSAMRISEICAVITKAVKDEGVKLAFVDHIHLADAESDISREQQISQMAKRLKKLASRLGIHICALAQLNKGGGGIENYKRRPLPVDLRDSGSLHEDADLLIMFHRSDYYHLSDPDYEKNHTIEIYVHKQKYGGPGKVIEYFDGRHSMIREWDQLADGPCPDWGQLLSL